MPTTATTSPPGTRPLPVLGDMREFSRDSLGFMTRLHERYGDVAGWSLGPRRQVMFFHPTTSGPC